MHETQVREIVGLNPDEPWPRSLCVPVDDRMSYTEAIDLTATLERIGYAVQGAFKDISDRWTVRMVWSYGKAPAELTAPQG
ncbi:hypothetical protein [Thiocapsa sp. N5-Cardenillas]|uniref:hypothetical protein n=1 Tax=Thiocapsa sp. N5-Cardenillas TaxID=3137397 RepID=UPI0035B0D28C